jgi:hypothetical protein
MGRALARIPRLTAIAAKSTCLPLAFLISQPRASHSTLVVARVSQVKLHVPIKDNDDLDKNINNITEQLEHGYNEILSQNHIKQ